MRREVEYKIEWWRSLQVKLIRAEGALKHVEVVYSAMDTLHYAMEQAEGSRPRDVVQAVKQPREGLSAKKMDQMLQR